MQVLRPVLAALLFAILPMRAHAQESVDLALVLAIDASNSVNADRWVLQMDGYTGAFQNKEVQKAIQSGPHQRIAVSMVHWGGPYQQHQVIPWTILSGVESAEAFAKTIASTERWYRGNATAIGNALNFSSALLVSAPFTALRKVIDISGDGAENVLWWLPRLARDRAIAQGIVINGLPIVTLNEPFVDLYYREHIIGGPGAFLVVANEYAEFAAAIRQKLVLELSWNKNREFVTRKYAARR